MNSLLAKTRKINWVLSRIQDKDWTYSELCNIFCQIMESNVYVIGEGGRILGVSYQNLSDASTIKDPGTGEEKIPEDHFKKISTILESQMNIHGEDAIELFGDDYTMKEKYHCLVPVKIGDIRYGTLLFARYTECFTEEDLALCEYAATVIGLQMRSLKEEEQILEQRMREAVNVAVDSLSFSEMEAIVRIFESIEDDEAVLVASKIADTYNITRSVVVNALRKLESAGVISSRSLGMKGTRIKITNKYLRGEVSKIDLY